MANQYGFYVPTVSLDHLVRDYAKIYGVSATALHDQFAMVAKRLALHVIVYNTPWVHVHVR